MKSKKKQKEVFPQVKQLQIFSIDIGDETYWNVSLDEDGYVKLETVPYGIAGGNLMANKNEYLALRDVMDKLFKVGDYKPHTKMSLKD